MDVANAWQKLNEADGVIPYLDYTTPTFYDDISGAIQELLAGKQDPAAVHRGRAGGVRQVGGVPLSAVTTTAPVAEATRASGGRSPGERPPGEPRLVGYLYLLPAFAVFFCFVLLPLAHAAWISLWNWDGLTAGDVGGLRRTTPRSSPTRSCAARSCTRWCCCSSTRCCRC